MFRLERKCTRTLAWWNLKHRVHIENGTGSGPVPCVHVFFGVSLHGSLVPGRWTQGGSPHLVGLGLTGIGPKRHFERGL